MSNYTQSIDFSDKDALPTGNPSKLGKGADVDTELGLISTAIASKEDAANKGANSGYAGLDSSGDVPRAQLPPSVAYEDEANVFTSTITLSSISPLLEYNETDGAVDNRRWGLNVNAEQFYANVLNDARSLEVNWLAVNRTLNVIDSIAFAGTTLTFNGVSIRNASILDAGTLADGRVAQSNVTQHQAALSIAETQITDGSLLARVAANEIITGNWRFTNNVEIESTNPLLQFDETGAALDERSWLIRTGGGDLLLSTASDAAPTTAVANALVIQRTGTVINDVNFGSTTVSVNGQSVRDAGILTSGTLADARVALSNVSQHAASIKTRNLPGSAGTNVTLQADPGGTPAGSAGEVFLFY